MLFAACSTVRTEFQISGLLFRRLGFFNKIGAKRTCRSAQSPRLKGPTQEVAPCDRHRGEDEPDRKVLTEADGEPEKREEQRLSEHGHAINR